MNKRVLVPVSLAIALLLGTTLGSLTFAPGFAATWWMATMAAAAAFGFVAVSLRKPAKTVAWAWVMVTVFVLGGVYKSINFWINYESTELFTRYREYSVIPKSVMLASNRWVLASLTVFLITAALVLLFTEFRHAESYPLAQVTNRRTTLLLLMVLGGTILASVLQIAFGLAVLGTVGGAQSLPFRLGTVINRFTIDIAPMLLLLCYWIFEQQKHSVGRIVALSALLFQGVVFSVISTSRGGLAQYMLPLLLLWILTGRFSGLRRTLTILGMVFFLLMLPFLTQLRIQRLHNSEGFVNDVVAAVVETSAQPPGDLLTESVEHITNRFLGAEGVWFTLLVGRDQLTIDQRIDIVRTPYKLGSYFTLYYANVGGVGDFRSPGILAAFMILGGNAVAIMMLIALYTVFISTVWGLACRLPCWPVILAGLGKVVLVFTNEGTLLFQNFLSFALVTLLVQMLYSWVSGQRVTIGRATFAVPSKEGIANPNGEGSPGEPSSMPSPVRDGLVGSRRPARGLNSRRLVVQNSSGGHSGPH